METAKPPTNQASTAMPRKAIENLIIELNKRNRYGKGLAPSSRQMIMEWLQQLFEASKGKCEIDLKDMPQNIRTLLEKIFFPQLYQGYTLFEAIASLAKGEKAR